MSEPKPPVTLDLRWEGDLRFSGASEGTTILMDSAGKAGPSPIQALAFALAGCMAMDVVYILTKGRALVDAMRVHVSGRRADDHPRRLLAIEARFVVSGDMGSDKVERAIALSREKYCSVWHSMKTDIELETTFEVARLS
jgi:putative redox protein